MHIIKKEAVLISPAKINLHLSVGKKRTDGYHDILSVFQQISIFDTISIRKISDEPSCRITGMDDVLSVDNIMHTAYRTFVSQTGIKAGIDITIEKTIPKRAGLGGGSSDAASVLIGLNKICGTELQPCELAALGAMVGSDVPFFCYTTPVAVVSGRGEVVQPITGARVFYGLLVCGSFEIETARAYEWIDDRAVNTRGELCRGKTELVREYVETIPDMWRFTNSFQPVITRFYPATDAIFCDLRAHGAIFTSLSGSGSAIYGLFRNEEEAANAYHSIDRKNGKVWKIKTLEKCPITVVQ